MSYTALDSIQWGGTPKIGVSFGYDSRRSGGDMQYRIYVTVAPLTGASYFGYPIYLTVYVDGDCVDSGYTLKQASPSRWSGSIEYDSGWVTAAGAVGSAPLSIRLYSGSGSTRDDSYGYALPVERVESIGDFTLTAGDAVIGQAGTLTVTRPGYGYSFAFRYALGSAGGSIAAGDLKTVNSSSGRVVYQWTVPEALAQQLSESTWGTGTVTMQVYSGGTLVGSLSAPFTAYVPETMRPEVTLETAVVNDNAAVTRYIIEKAETQGSGVRVYPVGAVSKGLAGVEMAEIGRMKEAGIIAISDDGQPVANSNLFRLAMQYADHFGLFIMSHSEDKNLVGDGVMNEGFVSTKLGLPGTTRAAEEVMIARDILVAEAEGKRIHLCHVSTRGGVQLVREAKARGVRVTAETTPHYIGATDEWVIGYDSRCRVNPPLREEADRQACIDGLCDGTIDVIATDHAPHHEDEKRCEFHIAASGISGFETAFCISNSMLVKSGRMTLPELIGRMSVRPAALLGVEGGRLSVGCAADVVVFDPDASRFLSRGKNTPFDGKRYFGEIELTLVGGKTAYQA